MANIAEDIRSGDVRAFEMFYRLEFNNLAEKPSKHCLTLRKIRSGLAG